MATREVLRRQLRSTETLRSVVGTMKALASVRIGQVRRADRALAMSEATLERGFQALVQRETLSDTERADIQQLLHQLQNDD